MRLFLWTISLFLACHDISQCVECNLNDFYASMSHTRSLVGRLMWQRPSWEFLSATDSFRKGNEIISREGDEVFWKGEIGDRLFWVVNTLCVQTEKNNQKELNLTRY